MKWPFANKTVDRESVETIVRLTNESTLEDLALKAGDIAEKECSESGTEVEKDKVKLERQKKKLQVSEARSKVASDTLDKVLRILR